MRNVCLSREHSGTARNPGGSSGRWGQPAAAQGNGASPGGLGPLSTQPSGCTRSELSHRPLGPLSPGWLGQGQSAQAIAQPQRGAGRPLFLGPWSPSTAVSPATPALHPASPPPSQPPGSSHSHRAERLPAHPVGKELAPRAPRRDGWQSQDLAGQVPGGSEQEETRSPGRADPCDPQLTLWRPLPPKVSRQNPG